MWPTIILIAMIGAYSFYVIRKRVKEMKAGKFCTCSCENCSSHCHSKAE